MDKNLLAKKCVEAMTVNDHCTHKMGMDIIEVTPESVTVSMLVREDMLNGFSSCHGGQIFTLADSTFAFACNVNNEATVAAGCDINYLNPAYAGDVLTAKSQRVSTNDKGRLGVYDVAIKNQHDILVATFRGRSYTIKNKSIIQLTD